MSDVMSARLYLSVVRALLPMRGSKDWWSFRRMLKKMGTGWPATPRPGVLAPVMGQRDIFRHAPCTPG